MKQDDKKDDERFNELVKRMKTFNELLGDYLDAIDMEEADAEAEAEDYGSEGSEGSDAEETEPREDG